MRSQLSELFVFVFAVEFVFVFVQEFASIFISVFKFLFEFDFNDVFKSFERDCGALRNRSNFFFIFTTDVRTLLYSNPVNEHKLSNIQIKFFDSEV